MKKLDEEAAGEEDDEELTEEEKLKKIEEKERLKYGRTWIFEGLFNEKRKPVWLDTAEKLKHVNPHVLEDI